MGVSFIITLTVVLVLLVRLGPDLMELSPYITRWLQRGSICYYGLYSYYTISTGTIGMYVFT